MRSLAPLLLVAVAVASPAPAQSKVSSRQLDNGMAVLVASNPAAAFVSLEVVFRAGANVTLTAEDAGLAHLLEHMLFRRGASGSIETEIAKLDGGGENGVTDDESVRYFFGVPPKSLAGGVDLIAKMVRRPTWAKAALEDEKVIVQGELERNASEPDFHLYTESNAALWGDQAWISRSPGGNVVAVQAATIERLQKMYERYYVPNNAALVVAGPVSDTAVYALAVKAFGNWKKGPDPFAAGTAPPIKPLTGIHRKVISGDVKDVTYMIQWHGPSTSKDAAQAYAADLFSSLVNQPTSRSQVRLVDAGIVDLFSLGYSTYRETGPITLMIRTSEDRAIAATRMIGEEILALGRGEFITDEDLAIAKKWQTVASHYTLESAAGAASMISWTWSAVGPDYQVNYEEAMRGQTVDAVRRFGQTYLAGKPYTVVVMIPRFSAPSLKTSIEQGIVRWGAMR